MRLAGKVALVTGASANIGGAIARGLAREGAAVACNDVRPDVAEATAQRVRDDGGDAIAVPADVTDADAVDGAVAAVEARWGKVDVLVNNAVAFDKRGLLDMPVDAYRRQLDVILSGAFLCTRAVARSMIDRGVAGSIVNVLSTAAWQGEPGNIGYGTGKSGMINFTRSVAMELAQHGIRVNGFTPTATDTGDPEQVKRRAENATRGWAMDFDGLVPLGRLPRPDDYVPTVVFLASDDSAMITGTNITVDGGATAKYWPWTPRVGDKG